MSAVDQIITEITQTSPFNYKDGLAGFGTAIEYFVTNGFIKVEADDILNDIDDLLHYHLVYTDINDISLQEGITGIGSYYISRLRDPFLESNQRNRKKQGKRTGELIDLLDQILSLLETSYNSYADLVSVAHFLIHGYSFFNNKDKAQHYLNYAIDRYETMLHEDKNFGVQIPQNEVWDFAILLAGFSDLTGVSLYRQSACNLLHIAGDKEALSDGADLIGTYRHIFYHLKLKQKGLNGFVQTDTDLPDAYLNLLSEQNLFLTAQLLSIDGLVGLGMNLLGLVNGFDDFTLHIRP